MAASVRRDLPNSRMFQVATLSVSSSLEAGTFSAAMRFLSASKPVAISLETFPWFIVGNWVAWKLAIERVAARGNNNQSKIRKRTAFFYPLPFIPLLSLCRGNKGRGINGRGIDAKRKPNNEFDPWK